MAEINKNWKKAEKNKSFCDALQLQVQFPKLIKCDVITKRNDVLIK